MHGARDSVQVVDVVRQDLHIDQLPTQFQLNGWRIINAAKQNRLIEQRRANVPKSPHSFRDACIDLLWVVHMDHKVNRRSASSDPSQEVFANSLRWRL